ncbi:TetR/AcrR family transcriptional regulator [Stappia sp.]|uniref:TetR/AcrR family transcriptional regulator n=1 Tax=Stappia sp. TaxID=1870903 RepID=UPI003A9A5391
MSQSTTPSTEDKAPLQPAAEPVPPSSAPRLTEILFAAAEEPGLRKGERTRRRVIWASAVALEQASYAQLSMDRIAEIAQVSRGALYQYVTSKEEAARLVLNRLQDLTLTMSGRGNLSDDPLETIIRTNLYYMDYYERNAVLMERVHELREQMPDLIAARQRVNREWAKRVMAHACRHRSEPMSETKLRLRVFALEGMIDDIMRELFIIKNPDLEKIAADRMFFVRELSIIWHKTLYE